MTVAITGGTGFVGRHLARALVADGHDVVLLARGVDPGARNDSDPRVRFVAASVTDEDALADAMRGCSVVFHCAGINRQSGEQTYRAVHVDGTRNVVSAAKRAGVTRVVLLSYLRARPDCGSGYLESKWHAEEIVRNSGLDYLVVKAGMIFGHGDHMLDHTAKSIGTFRVFSTIGLRDRVIQPVSIADVVEILKRVVADPALCNRTIGVVGPERLTLRQAATRVADAMQCKALIVPMPIWALYVIAAIGELTMRVPLISIAQVRLLREGPAPGPHDASPPADLSPTTRFDESAIRAGLPQRRRYGLRDLRWPPMGAARRTMCLLLETDIQAPAERCMELSLTVETHLGVPGSRETVVDGVRSGVMRLGDSVTWRSRRFGLPIRMTSKITELDAPHAFVDEMQRGPFKRWRHRHEFVPVGGGTRMRDEVEYSLPLGPLGLVVDRVFVRRYMTGLLRQQNAHIRELAEGSLSEGGGRH